MLTNQEKEAMRAQILEHRQNISTFKSEKDKLYSENKDKVDLRSKKQTLASALFVLAMVFFGIGLFCLLFLDDLLMILPPIIGGAIGVAILVIRTKPVKIIKELTASLTEYDAKVAEIDGKISSENGKIGCIEYELERDATERRYEQYLTNHICIYIGRSSTLKDKPLEKADFYSNIAESKVYVDGIEYGSVSAPFTAFEVTPGNHIVKIEGYDKVGGVDRIIESKAQQVKVTDKSVFMFYHWCTYNSSKGTADALSLNTYDNIHSFLTDTHKK